VAKRKDSQYRSGPRWGLIKMKNAERKAAASPEAFRKTDAGLRFRGRAGVRSQLIPRRGQEGGSSPGWQFATLCPAGLRPTRRDRTADDLSRPAINGRKKMYVGIPTFGEKHQAPRFSCSVADRRCKRLLQPRVSADGQRLSV
jgi:hypothetical protein